MEHLAFVDRVFAHLPKGPVNGFTLARWPHGGRPTDEAMAILPIPGVVPEKVIDAVMDVANYPGNIEHVEASRVIADPRFTPPEAVRFYQRISLSVLGRVQHDLVLNRMPARDGWAIAAWYLLGPETAKLDTKDGFRSEYSLGCWLAKPDLLVYAFSSAPKRDDVGFLKWQALTKGADAGAGPVLRGNLEGMAKWAARRR